MKSVDLTVISPSLPDERRANLVREIGHEISRETDIQVNFQTEMADHRDKGDVVNWNSLLLVFFSSGSFIALVHLFRALFERQPDLKLRLTRPDRFSLEIESSDLDVDSVGKLVNRIERFIDHDK